jgi:hypothetical protein
MSVSKKNQQTSPLHHIVPLWRNWDYLLLWSGQAISSIGSQLSQFALPLFVLALTGSPVWAGVAGGLRTIPVPEPPSWCAGGSLQSQMDHARL